MKKLLSLALLLTLPLFAQAQRSQLMVATALAANTSSNVLAAASIIDNFVVLNSTTNIVTVNFYDSNTTATNYTQAAYTSYSTYATNFSVVFTNQTGVLVTNTFVGAYTGPTANSASTNTRPLVTSLIVPASSVLNKDVTLQVMKGLTAQPDGAVRLITTYRKP